MKKLVFFLVMLALVMSMLCGLFIMSPVLLLFRHLAALPQLEETFAQQLEMFAGLAISEPVPASNQSNNAPQVLFVLLSEDQVEALLYDTFTATPSALLTITQVNTDIVPEMLVLRLEVEYHLGPLSVFHTTIDSEWEVRTVPRFSASPTPQMVEIKPYMIRAAYLPDVHWERYWTMLHPGQTASAGWTPLPFTATAPIRSLSLEEEALALWIASPS